MARTAIPRPRTEAEAAPTDWRVSPEESGLRLDELLARRYPSVSRMRLRQLIEEGAVRVDGAARPPGWRVAAGDRVRLRFESDTPTAMTPEPIPVPVLYEDEDLAVVDKPAGMVVHPAGQHRSGTLANALAHRFNVEQRADPPIRPGIVHRLDRATSGLLVVAKNQEALSKLTKAFQNRQVVKRYLALVRGQVPEETGTWQAPIGPDPKASPRWGVRPGGKPATTRFRVVERFPEHTLLELEPVTGRTNQLRLHAAHFGHPIVGDELFGAGPEPGISRLFLHAHRLEFPHPRTGERLRFESPLSPRLRHYLDSIRTR